MAETNQYVPRRVSPPGATIADLLEERGLSQAELAKRTGRTPKTINEIVQGKAQITGDTALLLERALEVPAGFWLSREAQYRESLARAKERTSLGAEGAWLREASYSDLVRLGWVRKEKTTGEKVAALLGFYGVGSIDAWRASCVPTASFRMGKAAVAPGAVAAWLRQGEREAAWSTLLRKPFDREIIEAALARIRALTTERNRAAVLPNLQRLCADAGLALVFVERPRQCPANGATRWVGDRPLIQMSLRSRWADVVWFTFLHEVGHVLRHGKRAFFVEGLGHKSKEEDEADAFASEILIPRSHERRLAKLRSRESVVAFARDVGVDPGIVVGRLQHEEIIPRTHLNALRWRF